MNPIKPIRDSRITLINVGDYLYFASRRWDKALSKKLSVGLEQLVSAIDTFREIEDELMKQKTEDYLNRIEENNKDR